MRAERVRCRVAITARPTHQLELVLHAAAAGGKAIECWQQRWQAAVRKRQRPHEAHCASGEVLWQPRNDRPRGTEEEPAVAASPASRDTVTENDTGGAPGRIERLPLSAMARPSDLAHQRL